MDVNVKVTVDLGDKTLSLFGGLMAANNAVANAADTAGKVLKKYADDSAEDVEPEKTTRSRRSRKAADEAPTRSLRSRPEPEPEEDDDKEPENDDARPERPARKNDEVTRDDVRDLMAEVIGADEDNRTKVLKRLNKIGAKSVGSIPDEEVADFFEFLQSLKDA